MILPYLTAIRNALLDKLVGCKTVERAGYYLKDDQLWRESEYYCERCGKFFFRSHRRLAAGEFWEDDSCYLMPLDAVAEK